MNNDKRAAAWLEGSKKQSKKQKESGSKINENVPLSFSLLRTPSLLLLSPTVKVKCNF